ncbi:unnamed protein product [Oppiella nova]|uniref:Uncharacterized protein n=1 Tax=Oppiella nova TaxID=334625 RepID=A0A7R9Q9P1_9ACAR|nr:unnamed protein product [Oppiella nova]CAG2161151.1 unnamed protein product [Oppiella nova]
MGCELIQSDRLHCILEGHWYSVYNRSPINGVCPQLNIKVGDGSVNVVESLGNNTVFSEKFVPDSHLKGRLDKVVWKDTYRVELSDQWSIYSRTPNPSADSVAKSVQRLMDTRAVNANGELGYHCYQ